MTTKPDMSNLAMMMLRWEKLQLQADELRGAIEDTVMEIKRTQTVGNVRAVYSGGRKSYDYLFAAGIHPMISEDVMQAFTITPPPRTDWRKICKHLEIPQDKIPYIQSEPSVRVKLLTE